MKDLSGVQPLELDSDLRNIYGKSGGDDLCIVNELYEARSFRKLHLETALFGTSMEILHVVFFPHPNFDLPIFGLDIVAISGRISAAIVDLSPVSKKLPLWIDNQLKQIKTPVFQKVRDLPEWGDIFSSYVQFVSPVNSTEKELFKLIIDKFLDIIISYSDSIVSDPMDSSSTMDRYKGQLYYCLQQKRNDKTRAVLANAFSPTWANRYIDMVLFDSPKKYQGNEN